MPFGILSFIKQGLFSFIQRTALGQWFPLLLKYPQVHELQEQSYRTIVPSPHGEPCDTLVFLIFGVVSTAMAIGQHVPCPPAFELRLVASSFPDQVSSSDTGYCACHVPRVPPVICIVIQQRHPSRGDG